jgi:hypothetical protein
VALFEDRKSNFTYVVASIAVLLLECSASEN